AKRAAILLDLILAFPNRQYNARQLKHRRKAAAWFRARCSISPRATTCRRNRITCATWGRTSMKMKNSCVICGQLTCGRLSPTHRRSTCGLLSLSLLQPAGQPAHDPMTSAGLKSEAAAAPCAWPAPWPPPQVPCYFDWTYDCHSPPGPNLRFHVDDLSSAHVYLRLPEGVGIEDIPEDTLEDCAQLVKQNSIQGCKLNNVGVVYTMWSNLRKTAAMEVGQVGFRDEKAVRRIMVERKLPDVINRLEKTRKEVVQPDLAGEKEAYEVQARSARKAETQAARAAERAAKEETRRAAELREYKGVMKEANMTSNKELASKYKTVEEYEDDFM
ncbi:NFACT-R_1 domain-containing protein, partial [Haematococcus lacustris]